MGIENKLDTIREIFVKAEKVLLAFSGGIDSTLLSYIGKNELGNNMTAITVNNGLQSTYDLDQANYIAKNMNLRHRTIEIDVLTNPNVKFNSRMRCYFCKKHMFSELNKLAIEDNCILVEGSHSDDINCYRPGQKAINELGVTSPFQLANMTKSDIRQISYSLGLENWNAPSSACLATRFPYGQTINSNMLKRIETAETLLRELGFVEFRVRVDFDLARIEIAEAEQYLFANPNLIKKINKKLLQYGFSKACLDLQPFRSGSMDKDVIST